LFARRAQEVPLGECPKDSPEGVRHKKCRIKFIFPYFFPRFFRLIGKINLEEDSPMPANADETATNRKYKDSVFTKLFGTPEKALELYNAISGKTIPKTPKSK
jgi:hypothetical protein